MPGIKSILLVSLVVLASCEPPPPYPPAGSSSFPELPTAKVELNLFRSSRSRSDLLSATNPHQGDLRSYIPPGGQSGWGASYQTEDSPQTNRLYQPSTRYQAASNSYGGFSGSQQTSNAYQSSRSQLSGGYHQESKGAAYRPENNYLPPSSNYGPSVETARSQYQSPSASYGSPGAQTSQSWSPSLGSDQYSSHHSSPFQSSISPDNTYGHRQATLPSSMTYQQPEQKYGLPQMSFGYPPSGRSQPEEMTEQPNYDFLYNINSKDGSEFGHEEARDGESAHGRYHVLLPDGRMQVVEYIANEEGFKPRISFKEPSQGY